MDGEKALNSAQLNGAQINGPQDRVSFSITKSFGRLLLIPQPNGLHFRYIPNVNGELSPSAPGYCDVLIPLEAVGGLWATARAFLYGVESLDENIIIQGPDGDVLVKLYRDKPKGAQGALSGEEVSWLRIVSGRSEEERRRIKLGPRDLLCLELACNSVLSLTCSPLFNSAEALQNGMPRTKVVSDRPFQQA